MQGVRTVRVRAVFTAVASVMGGLALAFCANTSPLPPGTVVVEYSTKIGGELAFTWALSVDGATPRNVASTDSGSFVLSNVAAGDRRFTLSSLPSDCTSGADDRIVTVPTADTAYVRFVVSCSAFTATAHITVASTGTPLDLDGYVLTVGPGAPTPIATSAAVYRSFEPGNTAIALSDIEPNCTTPSPTQNVTAARHDTINVVFNVTCAAYPIGTIGANVSDPVGDTLANAAGTAPQAFDYTRVTTHYAPGLVTVTLKFAQPLPTTVPYLYYIDMDLDENGTTGIPPSVNNYGGSSQQGVDAYIVHQGLPTPVDTLWTTTGPALLRQVAAADSIIVYIPLEKLHDDGNMTITTIIGTTIISPGRAMDLVPNAGQVVSHVPVGPVPAAATQSRRKPSINTVLLAPQIVRWARSPVWGGRR